MGLFDKLLGKKEKPKSNEAVLIHLDGVGLPGEVYQNYDLATLEDHLIDTVEVHRVGEFDGNEVGSEMTTLYLYGPDADRLFAAIEPVLREYPLCKGARVVIRKSDPGSTQTEVLL